MTPFDGWVTCSTCNGGGLARPIPSPCPDCSDGLVPSDGEIEAAAKALYEKRDGAKNRGHREGFLILYGGWAKAALVAARRYQRKAEEQ